MTLSTITINIRNRLTGFYKHVLSTAASFFVNLINNIRFDINVNQLSLLTVYKLKSVSNLSRILISLLQSRKSRFGIRKLQPVTL